MRAEPWTVELKTIEACTVFEENISRQKLQYYESQRTDLKTLLNYFSTSLMANSSLKSITKLHDINFLYIAFRSN